MLNIHSNDYESDKLRSSANTVSEAQGGVELSPPSAQLVADKSETSESKDTAYIENSLYANDAINPQPPANNTNNISAFQLKASKSEQSNSEVEGESGTICRDHRRLTRGSRYQDLQEPVG